MGTIAPHLDMSSQWRNKIINLKQPVARIRMGIR